MFRGVHALNLDAKGRLAVPTRYREQLYERCDGKLVLTIDIRERCLLLYPLPEWDMIERKLDALPSFDPRSSRVQRLLMGHATDAEMDSHGRILVPTLLRQYANLEKGLVMVGARKKFELWDETHWTERRERWLDEELLSDADLPEELRSLSL